MLTPVSKRVFSEIAEAQYIREEILAYLECFSEGYDELLRNDAMLDEDTTWLLGWLAFSWYYYEDRVDGESEKAYIQRRITEMKTTFQGNDAGFYRE
ncbi:MAG TPA: hypothetical protein PK957_02850 [Candidatus Dojkabacteria bacterium]|nr:hypothetical protein [Candidatus Dojkabacteria bacterium]HQF36924.1 hypothetical protein [Candidatus Dojkabacteria bacterium]